MATDWEDCWADAAWRADVTAWVVAALAEAVPDHVVEPEDLGEHGEVPGVWLATPANELENYRERR